MRTLGYVAVGLAGLAVGLAAAALAVSLTSGSDETTVVGPGVGAEMMGGWSGNLAPSRTTEPSDAELDRVRDEVGSWLADNGLDGFEVDEVMAFTRNDYVAVADPDGNGAFELLFWPGSGWISEEPQSMMWNDDYGMMGALGDTWAGAGMMGTGGMMGGWYTGPGGSTPPTNVDTIDDAISVANDWLDRVRPGEQAEDHGRSYPGYYTIDTTRDGDLAGMVSVNADTGTVWYHGWHGRFLAEHEYEEEGG